ncbi:hypothetical protein [Sodalis-like endosymbiont of Proechinophthirus fluctus]|nr:hypothetical protein [Sodalis-like endosymbiont of Proechinophthirus fluctus]
MTQNAVLALRQFRLQQSMRPFPACGSEVLRCEGYLLPRRRCLCYIIKPS